VVAEPAFTAAYPGAFTRFGHVFSEAAEIGAATAIEFDRHGRMTAAAEPARRGGGSAMVVHPSR
jgi:gamma-glutamyltranspeptidase/glutathione hydrolase